MKFRLLPLVLLVLAGCAKPAPEVPPAPASYDLRGGTEVQLVLAKPLSAGTAKPGDLVPLLVAEDVKAPNGAILVPKGSVAIGQVTWSRGEGTLSGLMNRPARLEILLQQIKGPGNTMIELCANKNDISESYAFTRENTGLPGENQAQIDDLLKDEATHRLAQSLADAFDGKQIDLSTPEAKEALSQVAAKMGLQDTQKLMESGKGDVNQLSNEIDRLQRGDFSSFTPANASLTLGAVLELTNLAGGLGSRISRSLKGRTIHAYPGTKVQAYTARDISLQPVP